VKAHVRGDHGRDGTRARGIAASLDKIRPATSGLGRVAGRRGPAGEPVERAAHLIEARDEFGVEGCHDQPAPAGLAHETLPFQKKKRLQDRLPRDVQGGGELLLGQPLAWRETPVADRIEDRAIRLFGQLRLYGETLQTILPLIYCIQNTVRSIGVNRPPGGPPE
jgi:hypothetical protein